MHMANGGHACPQVATFFHNLRGTLAYVLDYSYVWNASPFVSTTQGGMLAHVLG